ncbi:hypothetical protein GCM10007161_13520 [Ignatzschineria indica]|uniref:Uncharacterized protein n=1 Tax=Ignatzschineria indica TaxID=472583 RepID=A0A2U2AJP3_9GAMM|nr:hypothetical protein [Ignatzschineria indica]PWD83052.1 hypothetical protein DC082_06400 [Ignatzschineria indica]GGZ83315.1 hypothetical protein GCM10007161_13520 [Ignatzschineria indica]
MVLNQIGGNSIKESQENLSHKEVSIWMRYMREKGSLNIGSRVEQSVGLISSMFEQVNSKGKVDLSKHFPNLYKKPAIDSDVKQVFEEWGLL